ncbi:MAG: hypothetical protein ACRDWD_14040 [Acidimicrobiia bacterium]
MHEPLNCDALLSGAGARRLPTGTVTITWNTGTTSTWRITVHPVPGHVDQLRNTGTVTEGLFTGSAVREVLSLTPAAGGCTTADLSTASIARVAPLEIGNR